MFDRKIISTFLLYGLLWITASFTFSSPSFSKDNKCNLQEGISSYSFAAEHNDLSLAQCLSKSGQRIINNDEGQDAIELAIRFASVDLLSTLLKNGADLNWRPQDIWFNLLMRIRSIDDLYRKPNDPLSSLPSHLLNSEIDEVDSYRKLFIQQTEDMYSYLMLQTNSKFKEALKRNMQGTIDLKSHSLIFMLMNRLCSSTVSKHLNTQRLLDITLNKANIDARYKGIDLYMSFIHLKDEAGKYVNAECISKTAKRFISAEDMPLITTPQGFEKLAKQILGEERYQELKNRREQKNKNTQ